MNRKDITVSMIITLLNSALLMAQNPASISDPRNFIKGFCEAEYNAYGDQKFQRRDFVRFGPRRQAEEWKRDVDFGGGAIDCFERGVIIVDSFTVIGIHVTENTAEATVVFRRLAEITDEDSVITDHKGQDTVDYKLVKEKSRWWVLDPPLPRLSIEVVIKGYEGLFSTLGRNWIDNSGLSENQRTWYYKEKRKLSILKSLTGG